MKIFITALYEYLSAGRPVITSDTSGFELLVEYQCGLLAKPKDPESMTEKIIELLENLEKRLEMGKNARTLHGGVWKLGKGNLQS